MLRKKAFWKKLKKETPQWVKAGIIDPVQQETILAQYAPRPANVRARLPVIVIGLAVILIGAGLFLFYAANWRKMPPAFKLFQVFALMIGLNGLSYYLLAVRQESERIGRAFLRLGMIAFGAGIALVAQIYHISAHPSNGVLLWSLGVLAMAWIMRDRWGYYLTLLLALIWNWWEYSEYGRPNYLFVLFPVLILVLFVQVQEKIGALLSVVALLFWYHQVNLYWVHEFDVPFALFFLLYLPFGLILIALGRSGEPYPSLRLTSRVITFVGWVSVFLPLIVLSWPRDWFDALFPWFDGWLLSFEFLMLMGAAAAFIYRRFRRGERVTLMAACLGYCLLSLVLPLGHLTTFVLFSHIGLLAYFFGLLYASYRDFPERRSERFLAFALPIAMICSKGIGFLGLGFDSRRFLVAYGIGFIIFGTVCLLINQAVQRLVIRDDPEFPHHIINSVCAVMGFGTLYALSFRVEDQTSVFHTTPVVLALLLMFIGLALGLYGLLWLKSSEKLVLGLSAVIFLAALFTLLIAGPQISWVIYALIFNILLFLMTATLIYYSARINSAKLANLAILGFVVQVVTRYFDIFLDLFSGSLLFILTGLLALGGGYLLERSRRTFIRRLQQPSQEEPP